jgi:hypothetical protein
MEGVTRIQATRCPQCDARLSAVGDLEDGRGPQAGDPVACLRCGAIMMFEAGGVRGFTDAEAEELLSDHEAMDNLARLVRNIQLFRAVQN